MSKRAKLGIAGAVVIIMVPGWVLLPGLRRCWAYYRLTSDPSMLAVLSVKPSRIELPVDKEGSVLSLGYSRFVIEPELIESIKCYDPAIAVECKEWKYGFHMLFSRDEEQDLSDGFLGTAAHLDAMSKELKLPVSPLPFKWGRWKEEEVHPAARRVAREMREDRYSWSVKVANTMPMKYSEVFFAEPDEFKEYLILTMCKVIISSNERGIGVFDDKYVSGIIRFGDQQHPDVISAEVYSKESNIWQSIAVTSDSGQKRMDALLSLLASYRFVISEVPDEDRLYEMIMNEIEKNDKFEETEYQNQRWRNW